MSHKLGGLLVLDKQASLHMLLCVVPLYFQKSQDAWTYGFKCMK